MKRILIVGGLVKGGGISKFIIDLYPNLKIPNIEFEFMVETGVNDYVDIINDNQLKVHYVTPFKDNPIAYCIDWKRFLRKNKNKYYAIHFHYDSLHKFFAIRYAKKIGIKRIIVHSHNSNNNLGIIKKFLHYVGKRKIDRYATDYIACSDKAAEWFFFPDKIKNVKIINNAIDIEKFKFNPKIRNELREKWKLNDDVVVYGHVGRFEEQKNHSFLIDIFYELQKQKPNVHLILVGRGSKELEIKRKVEKLSIQDKVTFLGYRDDIADIYNAFDVLIFPSLFEGQPISLIEAQANGLPIFYSDTITKSIKLLPSTKSISLDKDAKYWADIILENSNFDVKRDKAYQVVSNKGYSRSELALKFKTFYENL